MRVLFIPRAAGPPYHLMVPLAWSLRNAGHEVRVAGPPDAVDAITDAGLPAVAIESTPTPEGDLVDFVTAWPPDVVIHSPGTVLGPLAAAVAHARNFRFLEGYEIDDAAIELERKQVTELCAKFGVDPVDPAGVGTLDPLPVALSSAGYTPIRHVPYHGPGVVPDWLLDRDRPVRVAIVWDGTPPELGALQAELVDASSTGAPVNMVLAACDAVIHRGAADLVMTGAALGVPQLVVAPEPGDQALAARLAELGAGLVTTDPAEVARLLRDTDFARAAQQLRADIEASPSPVDTTELVTAEGGTK